MKALFNHARIRLAVALKRPVQLGLLVFCGLCAVLFWPGLTDASGSGWMDETILDDQGPALGSIMMLIYVVGLPMVAIGAVRGSAAQSGRHTAWAVQAHPTLPIGPRARVLAETLAALVPIVFIRTLAFSSGLVPARFWLGLETAPSSGLWFLRSTIAGSIVMALLMLVTGSTSRSIESHWLRSIVAGVALLLAMKLGMLESLWRSGPTIAILATLTLTFVVGDRADRSPLLTRMTRFLPTGRRRSLVRPPLAPESRFHRDLWSRTLPAAAVLVGAEVLLLVADWWIEFPRLVFFFLSVLVVAWLVAFVTLKPMNSKLAVAGMLSKPGFRPGDFFAALAVLPLRRNVIGRGVFLFGLVSAASIWLFAVAVIVVSAWLGSGHAAIVDSDGNSLTRLSLLMTALVPALAGFLTSAVFGDKRGAALSGAILLLYPPLGTMLLLGRTSSAMMVIVFVVLGVVSVAPTLKFLRPDLSRPVG